MAARWRPCLAAAAACAVAWLLPCARASEPSAEGDGARKKHALDDLTEIFAQILRTSGPKKHAADDLTDDNFDAFMKEHPVTAILFYAPWCYYSQQVMPAWDIAEQKLMLHDPPVHLAKIDASRYDSVGERYGVDAFPTMKLFADGVIFEYDSHTGRGWQQIVKWVNRHIDRDHVLKSAEDVDHYLHDNDLNVVGLFPDGHNSTTFGQSARHFEDVFFAEARGTAIAGQVGEKLARHAHLVCETVDVGQNKNKTKEVELPRADMLCDSEPRNPQRKGWTDTFEASVRGKMLTVRRNDSDDGWMQLLQLRCCDDENSPAIKDRKFPQINVPSVVMFMPHDERFAVYDGSFEDTKAMDRWVSARRVPVVMHLTTETAETMLEIAPGKMPILFLIRPEPHEALERELTAAAKELRGRVLACFAGTSSRIERRFMDLIGIEDDTNIVEPIVLLLEMRDSSVSKNSISKYRLPTAGLKASAVVQAVASFEARKLRPWLRSEPAPAAEDLAPDGVTVLVGDTFRDAVEDTSKDVLVDFYAPWCGHCRKFEPQYKALAKNLKHVRSLTIAKIDATRNEVEGLSISGYPTIALFPAREEPHKYVVRFQGPRTPEALAEWLGEHCSIKFSEKPEEEQEVELIESGLLDPSEEDL